MFSLSKRLLTRSFIISSLFILGLVSTVLAGSYTFSGVITTSDTPLPDCDGYVGAVYTPNYGKIIPFQVTVTGTYTLDNASPTVSSVGTGFFYGLINDSLPTSSSDTLPPPFAVNNVIGVFETASANLTAGQTYYFMAGSSGGCQAGTEPPIPFSVDLSGPGEIIPDLPPPTEAPSVEAPTDPVPVEPFTDGRINDFDAAAPIVVYPIQIDGNLGLIIYSAYEKMQLLLVTPEEIAATNGMIENTLIAQDAAGQVAVYRLSDGTFQINAPMSNGKLYVLNFAKVIPDVPYTSTEVE